MKKVLFVALAMALLCIMAVGGTLSYFTDTAFEENVMAVGKVDITQAEQARDGSAFQNGLKMLPVVGTPTLTDVEVVGLDTYQMATQANVVDKIVTVSLENGSEDAYIRTLFAFEMVNGEDPIEKGLVVPVWNIGENVERIDTAEGAPLEITIGTDESAVHYVVYVYTYTAALTSTTNVSAPSLLQFYLASSVGNEFLAAVGAQYNILVLSQAVQAQGFDTADAAFEAAFPFEDAEGNPQVAGWFNEVE